MKRISFSAASILSYILLFISASCTHDPENIDEFDYICFDTQVYPLLKISCGISGCHDGGEEHFNLTDYNSVMELVTPGDPRNSALYKIITDIRSDDMMPPDNPLSQTQRNIIQVWIAQGAKEIICSQDTGVIPADMVCFVQDILPMIASSCGTTGCHDQVTAEEDYVFTHYNGIMEGIEPFDTDDSEIYESVTETGDDIMPPPPFSPLTSEQLAKLREWITDGALNSDCPQNTCDTAGLLSFSLQIEPLLKNTCAGCHNATLTNGNVNLSGYSNVFAQTTNLRNGIPLMIGAIKRIDGFVAMPPAIIIDNCKISTLEKWISQGAKNN